MHNNALTITVLGGTGFVGRRLLSRLAADGHRLRVPSRSPQRYREVGLIPNVSLYAARINDQHELSTAVQDADAVVNLVGILNESGRSGAGFHRAHVLLADRLIDVCRTAGVRRVLQMSALRAGEGTSHYLQTKGVAERHLRDAGDAGDLDLTLFRPSVIFGPGDSFFNRFHGLLKLTPVLPLARPHARFQPVYVGDVAEAFARALGDTATHGQAYALCGPHSYSLRELVAYTAACSGLSRRIIGLPDWLSRIQGALMDFVPGKPFSSDNYKSLLVDSTAKKNGFGYFRIRPHSIESIVPAYLGNSRHQQRLRRFRRHARRRFE